MKVIHVIIIFVKNNKQEWDAYCETPSCLNFEAKEEKKEACEMENSEVL